MTALSGYNRRRSANRHQATRASHAEKTTDQGERRTFAPLQAAEHLAQRIKPAARWRDEGDVREARSDAPAVGTVCCELKAQVAHRATTIEAKAEQPVERPPVDRLEHRNRYRQMVVEIPAEAVAVSAQAARVLPVDLQQEARRFDGAGADDELARRDTQTRAVRRPGRNVGQTPAGYPELDGRGIQPHDRAIGRTDLGPEQLIDVATLEGRPLGEPRDVRAIGRTEQARQFVAARGQAEQ